ncbi:DUF2782 domain-containing protein [Marinobacter zhejiangensis]|uniref:DUF2782 domain-containing protein n=1 Tax=Marinobacter zhejiangensis TaxID=488535 RepID=A0A1I4MGN1_9GAMM|nr:DUF2782 domain-containing protein [Marinobacter zhejiangensis]SFM02196.1 Protein of unknown function [Marinobacter zhejiangensis]
MKTMRFPRLTAVTLAVFSMAVMAQDAELPTGVEAPAEPVVVPEYQPDLTEPQVIIRGDEDEVIYEYRVNGEIVEIKVVPSVGPAYYLVPADSGGWERTRESRTRIPSWVIFRW